MRAALARFGGGGEWVWSGVSALMYSLASLGMVCLNHVVLDDFGFPSTTLILVAQVCATLAAAGAIKWLSTHKPRTGKTAGTGLEDLAASAAPKLACLLVLDVAFGHAATRALGLDAFATLRRCCIPVAAHLEPRVLKVRRPTCVVVAASWTMVLGPLLGVAGGERRGLALDATSFIGVVYASVSACVVAARVVYLRCVIIARDQIIDRHAATRGEDADDLFDEERRGLLEGENEFRENTDDDHAQAKPRVVVVKGNVFETLHVDDVPTSPDNDKEPYWLGTTASKKKAWPRRRPRANSAGLFCSTTASLSTEAAFAVSLLARTAAVALPFVAAFGLAFDAPGVEAATQSRVWTSSPAFVFVFALLIALGPVHEASVYYCVHHNSALTTLIAGGFKATALSTYRAGLGAVDAVPSEALGMALSSAASLVYTHAWWLEQRRRVTLRRELELADLATTDLADLRVNGVDDDAMDLLLGSLEKSPRSDVDPPKQPHRSRASERHRRNSSRSPRLGRRTRFPADDTQAPDHQSRVLLFGGEFGAEAADYGPPLVVAPPPPGGGGGAPRLLPTKVGPPGALHRATS